jgi:hypothetical protein
VAEEEEEDGEEKVTDRKTFLVPSRKLGSSDAMVGCCWARRCRLGAVARSGQTRWAKGRRKVGGGQTGCAAAVGGGGAILQRASVIT